MEIIISESRPIYTQVILFIYKNYAKKDDHKSNFIEREKWSMSPSLIP